MGYTVGIDTRPTNDLIVTTQLVVLRDMSSTKNPSVHNNENTVTMEPID